MSYQGSPSPTLGPEQSPTCGLAGSVPQSRSDSLELPSHPDAPSRDDWTAWVKALDRPIAVDLFSGAGGLSLGLENAGIQVVLAVDHDEHALATHRANFPGLALDTDLSSPEGLAQVVDLLAGIDVDVLAGGPPCQPFSTAGQSKLRSLVAQGKRPAKDERIDLWSAMLEIAARIQPKAVLMENVPGLALGDDSRILRTMASRLEAMGYSVDFRIVRASDHGVPQKRQRLIFVALRDGIRFDWPATDSCWVTVDEAIGDLPVLDQWVGERCQPYSGPASCFQREARAGIPEISEDIVWDHITRPVRDDDREAFSLMTPKTKYDALPERLRRYRSDIFRDKYKRLDANDLSRTITAHLAKDGYWYIHPKEDRTLSVREAARIQTFPDRFRFEGTRSHAFRQIGNAAPPALMTAVGKALLTALDGPDELPLPGSNDALEARQELHRRLLEWHEQRSSPRNQQGEPWAVLLSILCGRQGSGDDWARTALTRWPEPESIDSTSKRKLAGRAWQRHPRPEDCSTHRGRIESSPVARLVRRGCGSGRRFGCV
ncbi:MAG: DNA cytosine methyltransferase [Acidimicrobiaceae bacterium]|nr:DNA cytosine methyltransferase [Acidimicrobiaceae bacterium]MYG54698.1 DNA cytosine methyltransferase [Acidimicrobiaceae bacterium]MYJ98770.1 DNA cytosine methyltransferase [Acidimicrobiaceae bacterium]